MESFIPFIPPAFLFVSIYLLPLTHSWALARYGVCTAVTFAALWSISHPVYEKALFNYVAGFSSMWYIIWTANVFLVHDPTILRCLQMSNTTASGQYYVWQPLPPISSPFHRACWTFNLTTNFRGLGWESLSPNGIPPQIKSQIGLVVPEASPDREQIGKKHDTRKPLSLKKQLWRLLRAYLLLLISHVLLFGCWSPSKENDISVLCLVIQMREIIGTSFGIYGFIDGLHASISILATQLFGISWLGVAGMSFMYPPLFGQARHLKRCRIQDLWGRFWHDYFKTGLLSVSQWLIPLTEEGSTRATQIYSLLLCFGLSAFVHAAATYSASLNLRGAVNVALFFCIQPAGVVQQGLLVKVCRSMLATKTDQANWFIKLSELLIGLLWIYLTLPLVSRDLGMREAIRETTGAVIPRLWLVDQCSL